MAAHHSPDNTDRVSLVIPGRNCERTVRRCLDAVSSLLDDPESRLAEIIFVDDGSTDDTPGIVRSFAQVTYVRESGRGPAAARNAGWRAARSPLIWFVDSDCVAEPDALRALLPHMDDAAVGAVGGSYGIMNEHALLARLVHEEIIARHSAMGGDVNFLATFNVLYRRSALEQVGGFDERYIMAEDADLSFRVKEAGYRLRFEIASRVKHFHPQHPLRYLRTQRRQGYWRVLLHLEHRGHAMGDSYSSALDHVQPPVAMLALASLVLPILAALLDVAWLGIAAWPPAVLLALLLAAQLPLTWKLLQRTHAPTMLLFAPLSAIRAVWRGVGMTQGVFRFMFVGRKSRSDAAEP